MTFTNIQICNISDKLSLNEIEEKIIKFKENNEYKLCDEDNANSNMNVVEILHAQNSKFITIYDSDYSFSSLKENKSYIRKMSKTLTLPVFSITCIENKHVVIQQYNFNKRIYDYLSIGTLHDKLKKLDFSSEYFNNVEVWKEFFVGRNDLESLNKVIQNSKNYEDKSFLIEEMFKLYGVNSNMSLYNPTSFNGDNVIKKLYFIKK